MNRYLLCIGSNTDKVVNMESCRKLLSSLYTDIEFSGIIETCPFGEGYDGTFLNQLIILKTEDPIDFVDQQLHKIEKTLGRLPDDKSKGIVKIDIDLLAQNSIIIKQEDFSRPYISLLLEEIDYAINLIKKDIL